MPPHRTVPCLVHCFAWLAAFKVLRWSILQYLWDFLHDCGECCYYPNSFSQDLKDVSSPVKPSELPFRDQKGKKSWTWGSTKNIIVEASRWSYQYLIAALRRDLFPVSLHSHKVGLFFFHAKRLRCLKWYQVIRLGNSIPIQLYTNTSWGITRSVTPLAEYYSKALKYGLQSRLAKSRGHNNKAKAVLKIALAEEADARVAMDRRGRIGSAAIIRFLEANFDRRNKKGAKNAFGGQGFSSHHGSQRGKMGRRLKVYTVKEGSFLF